MGRIITKPLPFPEALPEPRGGRDWLVGEVQPYRSPGTDMKRQVMQIPLGETQQAANIRAHEMGHAAWSKQDEANKVAKRFRVSWESYQRAEDLRINTNLFRSRVDLSEGFRAEEEVAAFGQMYEQAKKEAPFDAMRALTYSLVSSLISPRDMELFKKAVPEDDFKTAETMAKQAYKIVTTTGGNLRPRRVKGLLKHPATIRAARFLDKMLPTEAVAAKMKSTPKAFGDAGWGDMSIEKFPLLENARIRRARVIERAMDEGVKIKRIDRIITDRKIFTFKRKVNGGTVLIDCSGSMGLSTEDIYNILVNAPEATVAGYSGGGEHRDKGKLRIFASKGKMVKKDLVGPPDGGGNIVDGPALAWLCKQQGPRIWVSDGHVTGKNELQNHVIYADADRLVRLGQTTRLPDMETAIKHFKNLAAPKPKGRPLVSMLEERMASVGIGRKK